MSHRHSASELSSRNCCKHAPVTRCKDQLRIIRTSVMSTGIWFSVFAMLMGRGTVDVAASSIGSASRASEANGVCTTLAFISTDNILHGTSDSGQQLVATHVSKHGYTTVLQDRNCRPMQTLACSSSRKFLSSQSEAARRVVDTTITSPVRPGDLRARDRASGSHRAEEVTVT